jgi:mannose-6-phosphate isomerase-like protein (cupin superfamily)
MNGVVITGPQSGMRIRDDRYGTVWELVAPAAGLSRGYGFAFVEVDAGKESPLHYHEHTEELYYITAGEGLMTLGQRAITVRPGDTVVIPPGERHKIRAGARGLAFVCVTAPPYDADDDIEV